MAGESAADARPDVAERKVDLVVERRARGRGPAGRRRARGPPSAPPRSYRSGAAGPRPRASGTGAALGELPGVLPLGRAGPSGSPARRRPRSRRCGACRRSGSPGCRGPRRASRPAWLRRVVRSRSEADCVGSLAGSPRPRRARPRARRPRRRRRSRSRSRRAPASRARRRERGDDRLFGVVEQRDAGRGDDRESVTVSFISMPETSCWTTSGMSLGSASMLSSPGPARGRRPR